jgi:hypothetical protein
MDTKRQTTKPLEIYAFGFKWPHEKHVHERDKICFFTFVDNFLKMWIYMMKAKGWAFQRFEKFRAYVKLQSEHEI